MKTYISILASALLLASCSNDDDRTPSTDFNPKNELRLNNLRIGQSNRYVAFLTDCVSGSPFQYTGDTLVVEVVSAGGGLAFRESYTPGSTHNAGYQPVTYPVKPRTGYLLIPEREHSQLFFFFGNDTVPVQNDITILLNQGECYIEYAAGGPFIGEEVGSLATFEIGDIQYFDKRVVSCVPSFMNLDAYLIYDSRQLFISMTISQGFESVPVRGYAIIANE